MGAMDMPVIEDIYGYAGRILRINLSNGKVSTEPTSKYARDWFGSSGNSRKNLCMTN